MISISLMILNRPNSVQSQHLQYGCQEEQKILGTLDAERTLDQIQGKKNQSGQTTSLQCDY